MIVILKFELAVPVLKFRHIIRSHEKLMRLKKWKLGFI